MPDHQQRRKSATEKQPDHAPSTGRRGSHPQPDPEKPETRGERKRKSLQGSTGLGD